MLIDVVYKSLLTILNKENQGYLTPVEFNTLLNISQRTVFENKFSDYNINLKKDVKNSSYESLFNIREGIDTQLKKFIESVTCSTVNNNELILPEDIYTFSKDSMLDCESNKVIEKVHNNDSQYFKINPQLFGDTVVFDIEGNIIRFYGSKSINKVSYKYIRYPKKPNWTYIIVNNSSLFNPSDQLFQDLEITDLTSIIIEMLKYLGISFRELDITQVIESINNNQEIQELRQ